MKPEEKAKELVDKFFIEVDSYGIIDVVSQAKAKQCALMCVDEMIENCKHMDKKWHDNEDAPLTSVFNYEIEYWQEVKKEIKKL